MTQPGIKENSFQASPARREVKCLYIFLEGLNCETQNKEDSNANVKIVPVYHCELHLKPRWQTVDAIGLRM